MSAFSNATVKDKTVDRFDLKSNNLAFLADLDASFIYVPKAWLRQILLCKLACVGTDLITNNKPKSELNYQRFDLS